MQRINTKLLQILHIQSEIVPAESMSSPLPNASHGPTHSSSGSPSPTASVSLVHLVADAQRKFSECIGVKKLKVFVLDADVMRIWHVGTELDATSGLQTLVRKYSNVLSSICSLVLKTSAGVILDDPISEPAFNDTVDLRGGAGGVYLVPIRSPWGPTPLGMIQVARSAVNAFHPSTVSGGDPGFAAAVMKEKQAAQSTEDALMLELMETFARVFAGLLHHAAAQQLYDTCPREVRDARLAYITDRLDSLETEYAQEQAQEEAKEAMMERTLAAAAMMEQRILDSAQRERAARGIQSSDTSLEVERDAARRVSFSDDTIRPHVRDARRILSAGSSRKSITTFQAHASAGATPDMLYVEVDHADAFLVSEGKEGASESHESQEEREVGGSGDERDAGEGDAGEEDPDEGGTGEEDPNGVLGTPTTGDQALLYDENDLEAEQRSSPEAASDADALENSHHDFEQQDGIEEYGDEAPLADNDVWSHNEHNAVDDDAAVWCGAYEATDTEALEAQAAAWSSAYEAVDSDDAQIQEQPFSTTGDGSHWRAQDGLEYDASEAVLRAAPVGLISTDSMYAIDLNYSDASPADATPSASDSFSPVDEPTDE